MAKKFLSVVVTASLCMVLANGASAQETKAPQFSPYHSQSHKMTKHGSYGKSKSYKASDSKEICEDEWGDKNKSASKYEDCEDEKCYEEAYKDDCDEAKGDCYPQKGSSKYEKCDDEDECYDER